jgi:hypothetical protein
MNVKTKSRSVLRSLVSRLLREAPEEKKEEGGDSLDAQIDKYLSSYEAEAKNSKNEGLDMRMISRRFLREADEEEEDKESEEKAEEKAPEKLSSDDIDVKSFVTDVVRLVDNYDNLLEIRNTILRRATNYLVENYEPDAAAAFKEELLESYGLEIGKSEAEISDEYQAPKAGAAGPLGGGA